MTTKKTIFIYVCALVAGVLLIVFNQSADLLQTILRIIGVALAVPSIIVGVYAFSHKAEPAESKKMKILTLVVCAGCACFGLMMVLAAGVFVDFMRYVFAFLLVVAGLQQLILLLILRRTVKLSGWFYLIPFLTVAAGVTLAVVSIESIESYVSIVTGVALTAAGVNGIIGYFARRKIEKQINSAIASGNVIEVEAIEADNE